MICTEQLHTVCNFQLSVGQLTTPSAERSTVSQHSSNIDVITLTMFQGFVKFIVNNTS
jgi:hypothetical protein